MLRGRPFARRHGAPVATGATVVPTPLDLYGSGLLTWRQATDAVDTAGTLTGWADRVGGGALSVIAGSPAVSTDGTLGRRIVTFDGVAGIISQSIAWAPPGTEARCFVAIINQLTWTATDTFWGTGANAMAMVQTTASPSVCIRNTTAGTLVSLPLATWKMLIGYYSNSTNDYARVGSAAPGTGINVGNTAPSASLSWGARTSAAFSNIALAEMFVTNVDVAATFTQLVAYFNSIYPASVTA